MPLDEDTTKIVEGFNANLKKKKKKKKCNVGANHSQKSSMRKSFDLII